MTTTARRIQVRHAEAEPTTGTAAGRRGRGVLVALGVCVAVAALAGVPLIANHIFYFWDDSAAQFLPTWYHLGQQVLGGNLMPTLDLNSWMGGNIAAEALFGIYNPVNVANFVLVALLPDLALAAVVVKTEFVMLLALGTYLVCREYGAARWAAAAVAIALPFGGFTLYFDTSVWAAGLICFAWVPHVWWSARRAALGRLNPIWAFLIGALTITSGNPYGVLGAAVVLSGLLVEFGLRRDWPAVRRTVGLGCCIGAVVPLVFLPLLGTSAVTWRSNTGGIDNTNMLVPGLGDLLNSSMPSYLPQITAWGGRGLSVPAAYFAWFALPLLAWLDWRAPRRRRWPIAALVVALIFASLTLGPSQLWMFRWPVRLTEYTYLGAAVLLAVALSAGLRRDNWPRRALISGALLLAATYLAIAVWPAGLARHLAFLAILAVLTALAVVLSRRGGRWSGFVLAGGTAVVLLVQTSMFPGNYSVQPYHYPHSVQALHDTFAQRYQGTTMQFAILADATPLGLNPDGAWRYFLFGSVYHAAGVDSVNTYTGMGFAQFSGAFCMDYIGDSCPAGYQNLWQPTQEGGRPLADLMRVDTVVVQRALIPNVPAEPGWRIVEDDRVVTVLHRQNPLPYPAGRLGYAGPALRIDTDTDAGATLETVRFERTAAVGGPQDMVFARLNWPGYRATVNGTPVPVSTGPAGLVMVRIPPGVSGTLSLMWTPPGQSAGVVAAGAGLLGALVLGVLHLRRRDWGRSRGTP